MSHHNCTNRVDGCTSTTLCDGCYGREIAGKRPQARVIGQCWAEEICRGDLRAREAWPTLDPKTLAIATRKVISLTADPRARVLLAIACSEGAAAWWARRPTRYRIESG